MSLGCSPLRVLLLAYLPPRLEDMSSSPESLTSSSLMSFERSRISGGKLFLLGSPASLRYAFILEIQPIDSVGPGIEQ